MEKIFTYGVKRLKERSSYLGAIAVLCGLIGLYTLVTIKIVLCTALVIGGAVYVAWPDIEAATKKKPAKKKAK